MCEQIPISTLKAVSGLLSNTAANTGIKVEKSAVVHEGGNPQSSYAQIGGHIGGSSQYNQGGGFSDHGQGFGHVKKYVAGAGDSANYGHGAQISGGYGGYGAPSGYGYFEKYFHGGTGLVHHKGHHFGSHSQFEHGY